MLIGLISGAQSSGLSDLSWPSIVNRPTISGGVLSWTGPLGGGPNNGNPVRQSRTLTPSGGVATTADNQVIQGLDTTDISVLHNNVTIKQCRITLTGEFSFAIAINANITGLIIEDCLIDGQKQCYEGICPSATHALLSTSPNFIRRNNLTGFENHITLPNGDANVSITDNYFTACGNSLNPSFDGDCIELYFCDNVLIQHNRFDGTNSQSSSVAFNSMLNLSNLGPVTNITVNNNQFANCSTLNAFVICDGPDFGGGACTFSFTNNGFFALSGKGYSHGSPGPPYIISPNSGNYDAASIDATSGALINGSGQVG